MLLKRKLRYFVYEIQTPCFFYYEARGLILYLFAY